MPQIYRYLKLVFSFMLRGEHLPPHVHVTDSAGNQTIFDLIIEDEVLIDIKVRKKTGYKHISDKDKGIVKSFIRIYYPQIVAKWFEFFILHKQVQVEIIRKIDSITVDTHKLVQHLSDLNQHFYPTEKKQAKTSKSKKK